MRSLPQNRKLSAVVSEVWKAYPLAPFKPALAREAWKRFFIAAYVNEERWEAWAAGYPDPFPVRPVPSSELDARQMSELLSYMDAWCAEHNIELSK
jgi:hypothetical protein